MFGVTHPLTFLIAVLSNVVHLQLDKFKLLNVY